VFDAYKKRIYINRRLDELKAQARANLESELGQDLRKRRSTEVESAFGNVKNNFGIRRFTLKGMPGATLEWGLHSIAHNLRKLALLAVYRGGLFFIPLDTELQYM